MARGGLLSTTSGVVLSVIGIAVFNNYRRGTLPEWAAAKFLGRAAPPGTGQQLLGAGFGSAAAGAADVAGSVSAVGDAIAAGAGAAGAAAAGKLETWQGATLDAAAMPSYKAMVKAAGVDGVSLVAGSTFRSKAEQIALRVAHGCGGSRIYDKTCKGSPPTATPGNSNHEIGMAVDFRNCSTRNTAAYKWLAANASKFGWKNLPSEAWHWSTGSRAGS